MNTHRIKFSNLPWQSPAPGVRMKIHRDENVQIRLVEFSQDFVEADWCRKGHAGYVLAGQVEVSFDRSMEVFTAGDGIFIPASEKHRHKTRTLTDTATILLVEQTADPTT